MALNRVTAAGLWVVFMLTRAATENHKNVYNMHVDQTTENPVKKVHIVFMNHLDVGYYAGRDNETGLAVQVLNRYMTEYFDRAIELSHNLTKGGYTEAFIYTTQPWLVSLYLDCPNITLVGIPLKCPNQTQVSRFRAAVKEGLIAWHAGPMNLQTDNLARPLFDYGLDLSKSLDSQFGINRTHAMYSQRDVPGLTKSVIPSLLGHGVKAISVGVNPGTAPPAVPSPFMWKVTDSDKQGVIFFQVKGGYPLNPGPDPAHPRGLARDKCHSMPGADEVLCFAFRTDNTGPPVDVKEVLGYYEILRAEFPGAELAASTFDAFLAAVEPHADKLPVYTYEMGDTWIQGIVSDPLKSAKYRAVVRAWLSCISSGECRSDDTRIQGFLRYLIKQPEHTWGAHQFLDSSNWTNAELAKARKGDTYKRTEASWLEQRQFLDLAIQALADHPLVGSIKEEFSLMDASKPDLADYIPASPDKEFTCLDNCVFKVGGDGSLVRLYDPYNKIEWAGPSNPMAQLTYDTYTEQDFQSMALQYNYEAGVGYDKPNVTKAAHPERKRWQMKVDGLFQNKNSQCDVWVRVVTVDPQTHTKYGAPEAFYIHYMPNEHNTAGIDVTLLMSNKPPTRLPESISLNFSPQPQGYDWIMDKMGDPVGLCNTVLNGSQWVHGVQSGISYTNNKSEGLFLSTMDTPLLLVGTKSHQISPFPVPLQPFKCSDITTIAFNIFNNIWNTNYIYYYPYKVEDTNFKSRFSIFFPKY